MEGNGGSIVGEVLVLLALLVLNGIFSMAELAVLSSRKARLQAESAEGSHSAKRALALAQTPSVLLSVVQVGITVITLVAGVYSGATIATSVERAVAAVPALSAYSREIAYGGLVVVLSYFSIVIGELVPKRMALAYPEQLAKILSPLMVLLAKLLRPVVRLLELSSQFVLHFVPISTEPDDVVTEDEIKLLIAQGRASGTIERSEEQIVAKVFRLGDRSASSIMTPRNEIVWIDLNGTAEEAWKVMAASPHVLFPAGAGSIERIEGFISAKEVAELLLAERSGPLRALMREPLTVPGTVSALQVLEKMKEAQRRIAVVIDEYGGVDGIITLHDLTEAMVGVLRGDDADEGAEEYVRRPDGSLLVDASMNLEDVFGLLGLHGSSPEDYDGYHSLGGFVMAQLGRLPRTGERFEYEGFTFEVIDMDKRRVDKVLVVPAAGQNMPRIADAGT